MGSEVELFLLNSLLHSHLVDDVLLRSILDTDISQPKGDVLTCQHPFSVGTLVHDINLGQDTNSPKALRVQFSSHLKSI